MIDDKNFKDDKKLNGDIRNTNYPLALSDLYGYIEEKYEDEMESRKK